MAEETQLMTKESITALYPSDENKTYEGGSEFLLKWYPDTLHKNKIKTINILNNIFCALILK